MIPILYEKGETVFTSNGLGRLRDALSVVVTEERNSIYECDFTYPIDGANFDLIQCGRIIGVIHDDTNDIQPFDIVSYSKPINGVVSFHCVHISYRLKGAVVSSKNVNSLADAFTALQGATPSNPFTYESDYTSTGYAGAFDGTPRTVRQLLGGVEGSILDTYGGEYEWDKFRVILHKQRGSLLDFSVRYGLNLMNYDEDVDFTDTYTSCIPYWTGNDLIVKANKVNSGLLPFNGVDKCIPLDLTDKFETKPTTTQLQSMARSIMSSRSVNLPKLSIKVDFIRLQDFGEYDDFKSLLQCKLCDTINVIFPTSNGSYKIVKTEYDVLEERFLTMELGELSTTLSEALGIGETITAQNGAVMVVADSAGTSVDNATQTTLRTVTLDPGKYILVGSASFPSSTTGRRLLLWHNNTTGYDMARSRVTLPPANGDATRIQSTCFIELTESTEMSLQCYQNSGATRTVTSWYQYVRL